MANKDFISRVNLKLGKQGRVCQLRTLSFAVSALFIAPQLVAAQEAEEKLLPRIDVVGQDERELLKIPGAVNVVTKEDLQLLRPTSTEAALKMVPGIVIKPEEESGIVANIGLRGLSAADYKLLILEDGVPVAPGSFTGNARYYNPRIQRMESIEVLKGAASLRYGPNTIGGVINYKTKQPEDGVALTTQIGTFGYREAMLEAGGRANSGNAVGGINIVTAKSDGFQNKGYQMNDVMLKGGMALTDKQWLGVKFTHYENDANISYRGLLTADYLKRATYNPAPDDYFLTKRDSFDVNHQWDISSDVKLNTLVYWSGMNRDYWRFDTVSGNERVNGRWNYNDTVKGGNRSFDRKGIDTRLQVNHNSFGIENQMELGMRLSDESMDDLGVTATRANPRTGTETKNILQTASGAALFAQNRFAISELFALTPGVRMENYTQKTFDRRNSANNGATSNSEVMPGVGATFQIAKTAQLYGGLYKAFAPAQNADAISGGTDQRLDAERSINYEFGARGSNKNTRYELTAFMMDFDNQVVQSNSGGFVRANGGKTIHKGIEAAFGADFAGGFSLDGNLTYIPEAKFLSGTFSGNRVTYTPEMVVNMILGYKQGAVKASLVASYVGTQFTDQGNTIALTESATGFFTGKLDAYTLVDLNASYTVDKNLSLFASVKNLTDEHYIASLRQGIYAGVSRNLMAGIKYKF
ncbi:MAG: TonB-dependent receptor [Burkholderiaceae bacterium]